MGRTLIVACVALLAATLTASGQTSGTLDPATEVRISSRDRLYHAADCSQLDNISRSVIPLREATAKGYTAHDACMARVEAAAQRTAALAAWRECATRTVPRFGSVKAGDLLGQPAKGSAGDDAAAHSMAVVKPDGAVLTLGGAVPFRRGELVKTEPTITLAGEPRLGVTSLLRHNITRGRGAFEHQSAEHVSVQVSLPGEKQLDCADTLRVWNHLFTPATEASALRQLKDNPSGVLVDEVSEGMTRADVEGILGPPERKATVGGRVVYFYPRMKVTFVAGKVTNVE